MQILKRNKTKTFPFDSSDILPLFAIGTLGLQILVLLLSGGNLLGLMAVASKPAPAMVQLLDGRSVAMEPVEANHRTPTVIRTFVKDSLGLLFTWNAKIPVKDIESSNPKTVKDPGVAIGHNGRITTSSWQASFALKEDFRSQFLAEIAKMTPSEVFGATAQSVLSFESVSVPKPTKDGEWQVDIVANLLIFDSSNPQGLAIPFNKSVFITAIEPTTDPLPDNSSAVQQAIYRVKQSGLQIKEIRDLDIQKLNG